MDLLLQLWGGGCYLLNKVGFALAEGQNAVRQRALRLFGWGIYILGVPAWVIILAGKHNWIAASIEAGGLPAMLFGLYTTYRTHTPNSAFERFASLCTYAFLLLGVGYSLFEHAGLTTLGQLLEIGVMVGFLLGSYLLAKNNRRGWLLFMLMNVSMATLMFLQHKPLLALQQLVSLGFVVYGFVMAGRASTQTS